MEKEQVASELKEVIEGIVGKMGFQAEASVEAGEDSERNAYVCDIKTEESHFLIGQHGMNLQALQHIARVIFRKKLEESIDFVIDINDYRKEKNESLAKLARSLAEEAISDNREIAMRPMTPYERRVVHLELISDERVSTESVGEGDDRRIVIRPVNRN